MIEKFTYFYSEEDFTRSVLCGFDCSTGQIMSLWHPFTSGCQNVYCFFLRVIMKCKYRITNSY